MITFLWFVVALTTLLRRAEGEPSWLSAIAMGSGVLFLALVLSSNEVAAAFRADDLDPQIARYAFDEGQAAFANTRVALGSFAVCCGWVIASTRFFTALGGMAGHRSWGGPRPQPDQLDQHIWLPFYLMFWLWVVMVAMVLLRRSFRCVA